MPLLDTTQYKDSLGTIISNLVLQILSWMEWQTRNESEFENGSVKELMWLCKMVLFNRPKVTVIEEFKMAYDRWKSKNTTAVKVMQDIDLKKTTFDKLVKEYEKSL